ncbi:MAG: response regulator transcription factor [Dehalococcoidales bacterium]
MARILIVEDDPASSRLLNFRLKSLGHETIIAVDGGEALKTAMKEKPDLILLDIMMPIMNGFQVLHQLKAQEKTKDIPIIMLTSKVQEKDIVFGLESGAADYVTKPFSFAELIARVNRTLASRSSS